MWIRILIVIVGAVLFINGCNSLTSQFFGTHVLRDYTAEEVRVNGVLDADYVAISEVSLSGEYRIIPPKNNRDRPVLVYPLLTASQLKDVEAGQVVRPIALAWTRKFDTNCEKQGNCAPKGTISIEGLVRDMNTRKRASISFPEEKFDFSEEPVHVEDGRPPLAWYWNSFMMILGIAMVLFFERRAAKNTRKIQVLE